MEQEEFLKYIEDFESHISYSFKDKNLLATALTHSSYAYENKANGIEDNERLEFLGDTVLSTVISYILMMNHPDFQEGKLTKLRSLIVRKESLSQIANEIQLLKYIRFGQGEEKSGGRNIQSNAEDAMEALIGALFLDANFTTCLNFIGKHFKSTIEQALKGDLVYDYKSQVFEYLQQFENRPKVEFKLLGKSGPDHDKRFTVAVYYQDKMYRKATDRSKRAAEQQAAKLFLEDIRKQ